MEGKNRVTPPIVVGGTGGSGTRLVVRLLREMGVQMGDHVNGSEDALAFVPLYDRYINRFVASEGVDAKLFEQELFGAIRQHSENFGTAGNWGWKNPRSIYLLPLLDSLIPDLKFIHVIRHGLDMVVSANQNQLDMHGPAVLGVSCAGLPQPLASALLWERVNEAAADYGRRMAGRYFLLRYEDVCRDPDEAMAPLASAFGLRLPDNGWRERITPSTPRWPQMAPDLLALLEGHIGGSLGRFGYSC